MEYKHWAVIAVIVALVSNYSKIIEWLGPGIEYDVAVAGEVTLYGTAWCGYCNQAREMFKRHNIPFADLDVEKSEEARKAYETLGGRGVPVITIGNEVVYGFNYARLRSLLNCDEC